MKCVPSFEKQRSPRNTFKSDKKERMSIKTYVNICLDCVGTNSINKKTNIIYNVTTKWSGLANSVT